MDCGGGAEGGLAPTLCLTATMRVSLASQLCPLGRECHRSESLRPETNQGDLPGPYGDARFPEDYPGIPPTVTPPHTPEELAHPRAGLLENDPQL